MPLRAGAMLKLAAPLPDCRRSGIDRRLRACPLRTSVPSVVPGRNASINARIGVSSIEVCQFKSAAAVSVKLAALAHPIRDTLAAIASSIGQRRYSSGAAVAHRESNTPPAATCGVDCARRGAAAPDDVREFLDRAPRRARG
jgi:hypothetical protein